jgi:hypothetical protein
MMVAKMRIAGGGRSESRFMWVIQNSASSSVVSNSNFLNTSYRVMAGITRLPVFSIISDTMFSKSVPAKYSNQKQESIIFTLSTS